MIDVTLIIGGTDFSDYLSTYSVNHEVEYHSTLTAIDGTEYGLARHRPVITFSLIPLTDAQCASLYSALSSATQNVTYTNPHTNAISVASTRLVTNLDAIFGLKSIDGNRYYKGSTITLRSRTVV